MNSPSVDVCCYMVREGPARSCLLLITPLPYSLLLEASSLLEDIVLIVFAFIVHAT